jgi:indole-3-glycerol phosphate synthase
MFLKQIIETKRAQLARDFDRAHVASLKTAAHAARVDAQPRALSAALRGCAGVGVIAEFKRASPSRGVIRPQANPAWFAYEYEAGGAAAVSVLTEETYFRGSLADLREVRDAVGLPVLRKDFILDEAQLYEAAAAGADAALLIVAALGDAELTRLRRAAEEELGMDALVEVHTLGEMLRAEACGATLIGVNNRDLHTFQVSLEVSERLAERAPRGALLVSESGIGQGGDIARLASLGYKGFLVGESLMRAARPARALMELISGARCEAREVTIKQTSAER